MHIQANSQVRRVLGSRVGPGIRPDFQAANVIARIKTKPYEISISEKHLMSGAEARYQDPGLEI